MKYCARCGVNMSISQAGRYCLDCIPRIKSEKIFGWCAIAAIAIFIGAAIWNYFHGGVR